MTVRGRDAVRSAVAGQRRAEYLDGQPVVGVDPEPGRNAGVLVRHRTAGVAAVLAAVTSGRTLRLVARRPQPAVRSWQIGPWSSLCDIQYCVAHG